MARFIEDLRPVSVWTPWKKKSLFDQLVEAYFKHWEPERTIDIMPWEHRHAGNPPWPNAVSVIIGYMLTGHSIEVVVTGSDQGYYRIHNLLYGKDAVKYSKELQSIVNKIKKDDPFYSEDKELLRWVEEMDLLQVQERARVRIIQIYFPKKGNN